MTRILLVEDDASLGATLRDRLTKEGYEVAWTRNRKDTLELSQRESFDLYLFDVGLPDGSGFDLAKDLPTKPFILLTAQGDAESRLKGYELGAEEFVPKPFHLRELLLRIQHVLKTHLPLQTFRVDDVEIDFDSFEFRRSGRRENVASKDLLLLKLLVTRAPRVVSRDEALNEIWGEDHFPSTRTVDNSIVRLRSLLGEAGQRIESVRGVGYRWNPTKGKIL